MKHDILPNEVVKAVKTEGLGLDFGVIRLEIFLRDGKPRWDITRSRSLLEEPIIEKRIDDAFLS